MAKMSKSPSAAAASTTRFRTLSGILYTEPTMTWLWYRKEIPSDRPVSWFLAHDATVGTVLHRFGRVLLLLLSLFCCDVTCGGGWGNGGGDLDAHDVTTTTKISPSSSRRPRGGGGGPWHTSRQRPPSSFFGTRTNVIRGQVCLQQQVRGGGEDQHHSPSETTLSTQSDSNHEMVPQDNDRPHGEMMTSSFSVFESEGREQVSPEEVQTKQPPLPKPTFSTQTTTTSTREKPQRRNPQQQRPSSLSQPPMYLHVATTSTTTTTTTTRKVRVTVQQTQGLRPYMEDEYVVGTDCVAIFDGHGGKAVSRYLKQNLLAELQHQRPTTTTTTTTTMTPMPHESSSSSSSWIQQHVTALTKALDKVDQEVQKISHWSYQGSTAVVLWWIPSGPPALVVEDPLLVQEEQETKQTTSNVHGHTDSYEDTKNDATILLKDTVQDAHSSSGDSIRSCWTTLIVANIGDSRAILHHKKRLMELTKDHKPDNPLEYHRITSMGGQVTVGSSPLSVPRVNGNLALSRAVGDRSERPYVTAQPDIHTVTLLLEQQLQQQALGHGEETHQDNHDTTTDDNDPIKKKKKTNDPVDFIVLATDGLWDVMTNQEVVEFVQAWHAARVHDKEEEEEACTTRDDITQGLVQEALNRGSNDNITIVIVWLDDESDTGDAEWDLKGEEEEEEEEGKDLVESDATNIQQEKALATKT